MGLIKFLLLCFCVLSVYVIFVVVLCRCWVRVLCLCNFGVGKLMFSVVSILFFVVCSGMVRLLVLSVYLFLVVVSLVVWM